MKTIVTQASDVEHDTLVLPDRVLSFNTDTNNLHVHDGKTPGGVAQEPHIPIKGTFYYPAGQSGIITLPPGSEFVDVEEGTGIQNGTELQYTALEKPSRKTPRLRIRQNGRIRTVFLQVDLAGLVGTFEQLADYNYNSYAMRGVALTAKDGQLFAMGGNWNVPPYYSYRHGALLTYNPDDNLWTRITNSVGYGDNEQTSHAGAATWGDYLVFSGGVYTGDVFGWYHLPTNTFESSKLIPNPTNAATWVEVIGDLAYVIKSDNSSFGVVNLKEKTYTALTLSALDNRKDFAVTQLNGKLYFFGGTVSGTRQNDFVVYDPDNEGTVLLSTGPEARTNHNLCSVRDRIYLFAGKGASGNLNDLWEYQVEQDNWVMIGTGWDVGYDHQMVAMNDALYMVGGATSEGYTNHLWRIT